MAGVRRRAQRRPRAHRCWRASTERGRKRGADVRVDDTDEGGKWLPQVALRRRRRRWWPGSTSATAGRRTLPLEHVYAARGTARRRLRRERPRRRRRAGAAGRAPRQQVEPRDRRRGREGVRRLGGLPQLQLGHLLRAQRRRRAHVRRQRAGRRLPGLRADQRAPVARGRPARPRARRLDRPARARARHEHLLRAQRQRRGDLLAQPPARRLDAAASIPTATRPRTSGTRASSRAGDRLFAAWQDNRLGNNDIFFTRSADGGATFAPSERVDDTGAGQSEQSRPHLAWAEGRCYVVWEDNRNGNSDVYLRAGPAPSPAETGLPGPPERNIDCKGPGTGAR